MQILAQSYPNGEIRLKEVSQANWENRREADRPNLACSREFQECEKKSEKILPGMTHAVKPGWGMTPRMTRFGLRGRRTIQRVGGVLDSLPGKNLAITLTLPGSGMDAYQTLADYSGWVANRVKTWLYDQFPEGLSVDWFYVWELQRRGALHMHLCVRCQTGGIARRIKRRMKKTWIKILADLENMAQVEMFRSPEGLDHRATPSKIRFYCQFVRNSVGSYFAKYTTKSDTKNGQHVLNGLRPSRWWGCSRSALAKMKAASTGIASAPMAREQSEEVFIRLQSQIEAASNWSVERPPEWNKRKELIAYVPTSEIEGIMSKIREELGQNQSCLLEAQTKMSIYPMVRNNLLRRWESNRGRLDLMHTLNLDPWSWDILVSWIRDESSVDPEEIIQVYRQVCHIEQSLLTGKDPLKEAKKKKWEQLGLAEPIESA